MSDLKDIQQNLAKILINHQQNIRKKIILPPISHMHLKKIKVSLQTQKSIKISASYSMLI